MTLVYCVSETTLSLKLDEGNKDSIRQSQPVLFALKGIGS